MGFRLLTLILLDAVEYPGQTFIKEHIYRALHLGHSQANSDASLFSHKRISKAPKVQAWLNDPACSYDGEFRMMLITNFKAYLDREERKDVGKAKGKSKGKGKKWAQPASSDEDSDDDLRRKKAKGKARHNSSDLDGSSD